MGRKHSYSATIAGLEFRVNGREFPRARDYWEGNWLNVTVRCADGLHRVCEGAVIFHIPELVQWLRLVRSLARATALDADLEPMDPNFGLWMGINEHGLIQLSVCLAAENLGKKMEFTFQFERQVLSTFVDDLQNLVDAFPVKGRPLGSSVTQMILSKVFVNGCEIDS